VEGLGHLSDGQRQLKGAIKLKYIRSDGSRDSQTGRLDRVTRFESIQIRWFSWYSQIKAGPGGRWPKTLKGKLISSFSLPGNYVYLNGQSDNLKKDSTYSSSGNVKVGRCCR
jgi:hypothetical protein